MSTLVRFELLSNRNPARGEGGGHFHGKVIGMLVVFLGYKIVILVFLGPFGKFLANVKEFCPKQPSKLQFGYFQGFKIKIWVFF